MLRHTFLIAIAAVAGCTLLNPLDAYDRGSEHDAGNVGPTLAEGGDDGSCRPARWPARPRDNGGAGEGTIEFLNALRVLDFGLGEQDGGAKASSNYDLDGVCTCPGEGSCKPLAGSPDSCDQPGGADNAGGELLAGLLSLGGIDSVFRESIARGSYDLLIRVSGYNGGPDDTKVSLSAFVSNGTPVLDGGARREPTFDGNDEWTVDPSSVTGLSGPPYTPKIELTDLDAYVSGGVLVARVSFPVRLGRLEMDLTGAIVTGTLVKDAVGYHIEDGRFAGRWAAKKLLPSFAALDDRTRGPDGGGICGDSGLYPALKAKVCGVLDIEADPAKDRMGISCDAVSVSVHFSTTMCRFGPLDARPVSPPRNCPPSWSDDCAP